MENSINKLGSKNFTNLFITVRAQLIKNGVEVKEEELGEMVNDILRAVYFQE